MKRSPEITKVIFQSVVNRSGPAFLLPVLCLLLATWTKQISNRQCAQQGALNNKQCNNISSSAQVPLGMLVLIVSPSKISGADDKKILLGLQQVRTKGNENKPFTTRPDKGRPSRVSRSFWGTQAHPSNHTQFKMEAPHKLV